MIEDSPKPCHAKSAGLPPTRFHPVLVGEKMIFGLFRSPPFEENARALYGTAMAQARQPVFYEDGGVPDTVDGRFDMVAVHVFLILRRLKGDHEQTEALAQTLFDHMFADMEQALREMGVSDLAVGKKVKDMAKAFYGRIKAYDEGLDAEEGAVLNEALTRNLYRHADPAPANLSAMAAYVRREAAALDERPLESLLAGQVAFGPFILPETEEGHA